MSSEGAEAPEDNFAKRLLKGQADHGLANDEIATLTVNLIGGGVDTTTSTMISGVLALCAFSDVQKKAQEELDRVVGRERMPDFQDEAELPYLKALIKEVLRWRSVAVLSGIPHCNIQDDYYRDYLSKHTLSD